MRILILSISLIFVMTSCQSEVAENSDVSQTSSKQIVVKEVLQTTNYTYLFGEVDGADTWLAISKMDAKVGETYYFDGGMLMTNFVSKELNRTFEKIYFLDAVRTTAEAPKQENKTMVPHDMKPKIEKKEVKLEKASDGITIKELFSNREKYEGKTVIIKGVVEKFNPQIMGKNWIHIQDGTDHEGAFDLTVTSQAEVKKGDTITIEGKVALNKDFGYGYKYDIIVEDAVIK